MCGPCGNHIWNLLRKLPMRLCMPLLGMAGTPGHWRLTAAGAAVPEHSNDDDGCPAALEHTIGWTLDPQDSSWCWNASSGGGCEVLLEAGIMLDKPGNKLMFHHNITICGVKSSSKHYHCPPL